MEKQRAINKMNDIFQSQIVVICAFKGSFIDIGQPFDGVVGRDKQIRLMKGENVINVEEYSKLRFGFSFYNRSYSEYIKDIILDEYDTSYITDMVNMFYGCSSLKYLDLSGFDTSGVSNMCGMFESCSSLESLDLSGFNTSGITNMSFMFRFCSSLKSLDLSSFNTLNVTDMSWMFDKCRSLKSLDLSSFNISNVTNMDSMFLDCDSLEYVYLRNCNKYTIERITKALEEVGIDAKVITV
ncbi:BspA family leucine-rich repeat surface protein [Phocaeicola vulgatus]